MATILGGIATSHTPTIGFALDAGKQKDPVWAPIFEGYKPVQQWLADKKPDVLFFIYNDHVTSFFFDHYSHFALGVGERVSGRRRRRRPAQAAADQGPSEARAAHRRGSRRRRVRPVVFPGQGPRPRRVLAAVAAAGRTSRTGPARSCRCRSACCSFRFRRRGAATSSASRCARRSRAIRKTSRSRSSAPAACRTRCTASAAASTTRRGTWSSSSCSRRIRRSSRRSRSPSTRSCGGMEGSEVVMWLIMRGALSKKVKKLHQTYYLPSMTPIARVIFENDSSESTGESADAYRERIGTRARRHREARGHVSVHARAQRQGVSAERVPALADQARVPQAVPGRPGAAVRGARSSPTRSATWCAGATGAR